MRKRRLWTLTAAAAVLLVLAAAWLAGYRWNLTPSYPLGLWRMRTGDALNRGSLVLFCPPDTAVFRQARERGYIGTGVCPGGYTPLLKRVVALPGDVVTLDGQVSVNGAVLPNSARLAADGAGRPMPHTAGGPVAAGQVWLMSAYSGRSFDARYFGPIGRHHIQGTMEPVWTW